MKKLTGLIVLGLSGIALAQTGDFSPLLDLVPTLGIFLSAAAVLAVARPVQLATEWLKVRVKRRFGDIPHIAVHGIALGVSIVASAATHLSGGLLQDPVYSTIPPPWNVALFAVAVFVVAGGWYDTTLNTKVPPARPTDPTLPEGRIN